MVAYVLGITDVDPLQFNLLFERFLNPERVSPPDIDVDFCQNRRGEVIEYVRQKYGERARVADHHFRHAEARRAWCATSAACIGLSYGERDGIAKMIPNELEHHARGPRREKTPELRRRSRPSPRRKQLWDYALVLEGLVARRRRARGGRRDQRPRSLRIHPARRAAKDDEVVSQYAMGPLTDLGMLKMDFLGLKTLTVIHDAVTLIRQREPGFRHQRKSRSTIRPTFDLSTAAKRSAFSRWNPAA